jgi:hypothetical protein
MTILLPSSISFFFFALFSFNFEIQLYQTCVTLHSPQYLPRNLGNVPVKRPKFLKEDYLRSRLRSYRALFFYSVKKKYFSSYDCIKKQLTWNQHNSQLNFFRFTKNQSSFVCFFERKRKHCLEIKFLFSFSLFLFPLSSKGKSLTP